MANGYRIEIPIDTAKGVLRGEPDALGAAYELLAPRMLSMSTRILQDVGLAEEVVQDTFIDLVEKSHQIRDIDAIAAWVKRVAVNHCLMRLRSPWAARRQAMEDEEPQDTRPMEWVADSRTLEGALGALSEEARAVLWLHEVEGYTHTEIGELMGRTTSFSKSQLARAYQRLLQWRTELTQPAAAQHNEERTNDERRTKRTGHLSAPCAP